MGRGNRRKKRSLQSGELSLAEKQQGELNLPKKKVVFRNPKTKVGYESNE